MQDRKRLNWPPKPSTPEEAPWREIETLIYGMKAVVERLDLMLARMGYPSGTATPYPITTPAIPVASAVITPSRKSFMCGQETVDVPGTPQQLDPFPLPDGYPVTVIAKPGNAGNVYLGPNAAHCYDTKRRFDGLEPGKAVSLPILDLSEIWLDADNADDGISWIVAY